MTKRYTIKADGPNRAILTNHQTGTTATYWAPSSGGYVRIVTPARPGTLGAQCMDNRLHNGSTLHWSGKGDLADLMRADIRALLRRCPEAATDL